VAAGVFGVMGDGSVVRATDDGNFIFIFIAPELRQIRWAITLFKNHK